MEDRTQFDLRFKKLGFKEKKSKPAKINYEELLAELETINFVGLENIELKEMNLQEVVEKTRQVAAKIMKNVNMLVDCFDYELQEPRTQAVENVIAKFQSINNRYNIGQITDAQVVNELLMEYKKNSRAVNVFDIPIIPDQDSDAMQGQTIKGPIIMAGDMDKFCQATPVYMEAVYLGSQQYTTISVGTYLHEITHMLIDRHKGVVGNYYNDEFLSIFMEKIAVEQIDKSPDKKALKASEVYRLSHIKRLLEEISNLQPGSPEYMDHLKYIQSAIYAGILFDRYANADENKKAQILTQIRAILNGKVQLNTLILKQGLTLESEEISNYIKKVAGYAQELSKEERKSNADFEKSEMATLDTQVEALEDSNNISSELTSNELKKGELHD